MFVIKDKELRYYFHSKGKIILFEDPNEAVAFANAFMNYSIQRMLQETQNPASVFEVHQRMSMIEIIEQDFEEIPPCGVITFTEIKNGSR